MSARRPTPAATGLVPVLVLALVCGGAARASAASLSTLYYERTLMREADARCGLFAPKLASALAASALQARGAALRAGTPPSALQQTAAAARGRADATACASPDLRIAAQRVRAAFMSWSRQASLSLPGGRGAWTATRWPIAAGPFWSLSTPAALEGRPATFGLRRDTSQAADHLFIDTLAPDAPRAVTLRLVVRDAARAPDPYLADGPPPGASRAFLAADRTALAQGGTLFRLPDAAAAALAGLDPRERVRLELALPGGAGAERTVATTVEVGDFAAGRAFLAAGG